MNRYRIILLLVLSVFILIGCGKKGGGNDSDSNVTFNPKSFIGDEEFEKLQKKKDEQESVFKSYIKPMDYVIENILIKDSSKSFYYANILSKSSEEVLRYQLMYMELHRDYMKRMVEGGATVEELMLQNRMFNRYINIFEGKRYDDKRLAKSIIESNFKKYNIEEMDVIVKGENLAEFIDEYVAWEKGLGYNNWFKEEENANFDFNLMEKYKISLASLPVEIESDVTTLLDIIEKAEEMMEKSNYGGEDKKEIIGEDLEQLRDGIDQVSDLIFTEDTSWIRKRGLKILERKLTYLDMLNKGNEFEAVDYKFIVDVEEMEDEVAIYKLRKLIES